MASFWSMKITGCFASANFPSQGSRSGTHLRCAAAAKGCHPSSGAAFGNQVYIHGFDSSIYMFLAWLISQLVAIQLNKNIGRDSWYDKHAKTHNMEAPGQFDVAAIGSCYIGGCQRYFLYHFGSKTWCFPKEILSCQGSGMPCISVDRYPWRTCNVPDLVPTMCDVVRRNGNARPGKCKFDDSDKW